MFSIDGVEVAGKTRNIVRDGSTITVFLADGTRVRGRVGYSDGRATDLFRRTP